MIISSPEKWVGQYILLVFTIVSWHDLWFGEVVSSDNTLGAMEVGLFLCE